MKYKVNDTVCIVIKDSCSYPYGYVGTVTSIDTTANPIEYTVDHGYCYADHEIELATQKVRGFQRIKGYDNIPLPARGTKFSAGYDIASSIDITIEPSATIVIPTGIKAYMQDNEFLGLYVRSSIGKLGLSMVTGVSVIDSDYYENPDNDGHIFVMLRNDSSFPIDITKGTRLVQGIFHTYLCTDNDNVTTAREGGTGSTSMSHGATK